jgi:hypothetical protein
MGKHFQLRKNLRMAKGLCFWAAIVSLVLAFVFPLMNFDSFYLGMLFTFANWAITAVTLYALSFLCGAAEVLVAKADAGEGI